MAKYGRVAARGRCVCREVEPPFSGSLILLEQAESCPEKILPSGIRGGLGSLPRNPGR